MQSVIYNETSKEGAIDDDTCKEGAIHNETSKEGVTNDKIGMVGDIYKPETVMYATYIAVGTRKITYEDTGEWGATGQVQGVLMIMIPMRGGDIYADERMLPLSILD